MNTLNSYTPYSLASEVTESLMRDGAVVIEELFDAGQVIGELAGYFEATPTSQGFFYGSSTKRFGALMRKSQTIERLCTHPVLVNAATAALGQHCTSIQLNLTQAIEILPDEKPQFLHRDDELFPFEKDFVTMVNVMLALDDFTPENGGTRYVKGSHKWSRDREPERSDIEHVSMKAGSCLIYLGNLLHAGGGNTTQKSRRGAILGYNLGWLRQTENFMLSVPWDKARHYSDELKRLMGYQIHRPNVGWVEGMDPLDWIEKGRPETSSAIDALTDELNVLAQLAQIEPERFSAYL
ncbi:phytanoyl-CoA dioxygenase family protein [uncultured Algimonas sp.]|uniref:phytanoyl-CoA dioxygenase family protein n=1 Tax=uncultured Algimonas sp. TaxID=1547920 RepID=UPI00261A81A9|nr:phytanoyl-CoA dioxygenase family protein [uncultured Algimonas sp.]